MIIRVKKDGVDTNEWAIIEVQGDLESRSGQSLNDQFIGDLHYTKTGTPILIVGHHILYGKEVKMEKPFAVLEKVKYDGNEMEIDSNSKQPGTRTDYIAKAIVKKKLVFRREMESKSHTVSGKESPDHVILDRSISPPRCNIDTKPV